MKTLILPQNIEILCMQEIEIENSFDKHDLDLHDFNFEMEDNPIKLRLGIYANPWIPVHTSVGMSCPFYKDSA